LKKAGWPGWWQAALDWLFPPHCPGCGHAPGRRFCAACLEGLEPCRLKAPGGLEVFAAGYYRGPLRRAVLDLKHGARTSSVPALAELMQRAWRGRLPDALVPIPPEPRRRRLRGLSVPGLLAEELGCRLGVPARSDLLVPARLLASQKNLSRGERRENVRGGFRTGAVGGLDLLLVDDVMTTGSTLAEAARVLRAAGAGRVHALVLAAVESG
jgi:predicted amidophosphoribosyltransferase